MPFLSLRRYDVAKRDLLDELGRAFDLVRTAHRSVQAAQRAGESDWARDNAVRQWAYGVERYTAALERLVRLPTEYALPKTAGQAVERVRSQVVARIVNGRFIREGEK
jgi:hypothetical protein